MSSLCAREIVCMEADGTEAKGPPLFFPNAILGSVFAGDCPPQGARKPRNDTGPNRPGTRPALDFVAALLYFHASADLSASCLLGVERDRLRPLTLASKLPAKPTLP